MEEESYPTMDILLLNLGVLVTLLRGPSYSTFIDKVIHGLRGKLSYFSGALRNS